MVDANELLFILNEKNIFITENDIKRILDKYNLEHIITNMNLFVIATTHASYCIMSYISDNEHGEGFHKIKEIGNSKIKNPRNAIPLQSESYERLEYLGDAIIHAILAEYIFTRFPEQQEGFMTKLRTKLENSDTLARFTQVLGLDTYILMSRDVEEAGGRNENIHILEDVFEAFIGSLYIDGCDVGKNFVTCKKLVISLIETEIDIVDIIRNETNYKDILLQYAHKKKWTDPIYGTKCVLGNDNKKMYKMFVVVNGKEIGIGIGNSKKKGEQEAAKLALSKFHIIHDDDDSSDEEYDEIN